MEEIWPYPNDLLFYDFCHLMSGGYRLVGNREAADIYRIDARR
jgi:hypothetical protein